MSTPTTTDVVYEAKPLRKAVAATAPKPRNRAGRKTELERRRLELDQIRAEQVLAAEKRKADLYNRQESKRAPQFQIDQAFTLWLLVGLAAIMFVATAVLTADGTIGSAASARYAEVWHGTLLFGSIEVAVLVFMLVYYINGSRLDYEGNQIPATRWFVGMIAASVAAAGLSVYHVLDLYEYDWLSVDMWMGVFIRLITTVFFVLVTKAIATVLFAKSVRL